jgi:hypothetical protein
LSRKCQGVSCKTEPNDETFTDSVSDEKKKNEIERGKGLFAFRL